MRTTEQTAEIGVIVARFQSPILHEGHQEIIEQVRTAHPRVVIFLGLSPLRCTTNNPYDFAIRKSMIEEKYKDIEVLYIDDVGDDEIWSKNLDRMIAKITGPNLKAVLYGSRDSFINSYKGTYPTIDLVPTKFISASEIRRRIGIKPKTTQEFREGIVYAVQNQYPTFHPTVDLAIFNFDKMELLLARKPNQKLLRFVGGFMNPLKDKSAEDAAKREGFEETKLDLEIDTYIGSTLVDDWRYKREQNKIMTFLYVMRYQSGVPVASDDIEFVTWKHIGTIDEAIFMPEHRPLWKMFETWITKQIEEKWPERVVAKVLKTQ